MSKQGASKIVSVGELLAGKYRVEKILGMGGMGVVVAATHIDLREVRAVKLMRPDATTEVTIERFLREARAAVRLRSEHVAEIYDVGRLESGAPYIVMEKLEGEDLSALTKRRGPLPIEEAVLYTGQACHALAEAHAAGIVHRDLKPGNLFVTRRPDGSACIKVLDFGISKHTSPSGERLDPEMTGARDIMGSPLYMAPEQMRASRKVDARADIWSLGAILYKLLTGMAPFLAPTLPEIFAAALDKPVRPPSQLRPDIPPGLEAIVMRCLDKQPQNRFASASELLVALRPHGPFGKSLQDDGDATLFTAPGRRSILPMAPKRLLLLPENDGAPAAAAKDQTGESVAPWGATGMRSSPAKQTRRALVGALAVVTALSGALLAAFATNETAESEAPPMRAEKFAFRAASATSITPLGPVGAESAADKLVDATPPNEGADGAAAPATSASAPPWKNPRSPWQGKAAPPGAEPAKKNEKNPFYGRF
jgi:serine/threonine-protein kinase